MASNNYVPVKVLQDELRSLISEATLLGREIRLERAFMIYRLGLIDDLQYRDLNQEICKRFPADDVGPDVVYNVPRPILDILSKEELVLISEELNVRMDQVKYMESKYSGRSGCDSFVVSARDQLKRMTFVANKVHKLISNYSEMVE